jgi:hypothetical protein
LAHEDFDALCFTFATALVSGHSVPVSREHFSDSDPEEDARIVGDQRAV